MVVVRDKHARAPHHLPADAGLRYRRRRRQASAPHSPRRCSIFIPSGSISSPSTASRSASLATSARSPRMRLRPVPAPEDDGEQVYVVAPHAHAGRPRRARRRPCYCSTCTPSTELDVVYMLRIQRERLEGAPFPKPARIPPAFRPDQRAREVHEALRHQSPPWSMSNRGVELNSHMADHPQRWAIPAG